MRSRRPSSRPEHCGPRNPLPPLNATSEKPIRVNARRLSAGGTSAAASMSVGMPVACPTSANSSREICPWLVAAFR